MENDLKTSLDGKNKELNQTQLLITQVLHVYRHIDMSIPLLFRVAQFKFEQVVKAWLMRDT